MTVVKVMDWSVALAWYVETLGLLPVLTDTEHQFALLAAGTGRLALQGDPQTQEPEGGPNVRLVFLVPDVDEEWRRLTGLGVAVSSPVDNVREGYREIRLCDPEGTALTLFSWTRQANERRSGNPAD